jgi:D-arabinose 1-dehydrogenase-like Zn-dependent alcohol dehydrogenase
VPEGIDPAAAAPLFCGGVTVFSPLVEHGAGTTAKNVGVIGIGGLGHFAVLFAAKMGARVSAISRGTNKAEDARALGATDVIATGDNISEGIKGHERSLDLIICTISKQLTDSRYLVDSLIHVDPEELPIAEYLPLLRPHGTFVLVGVVPKPLSIPIFSLLGGESLPLDVALVH